MFSSKVVESWLVLLYSGQGSNLCLCGGVPTGLSGRRRNLRIRNPWPLALYKGMKGVGHQNVSILKMFLYLADKCAITGFGGLHTVSPT